MSECAIRNVLGEVFSTIPTTLNAMPIICDATWIVWSGVECHAGIAV